METVELKVEGMDCDGCVKSVTRMLSGVAGVEKVDVSLQEGRATVSYDRKVKLWSVSTHQELVTFPFAGWQVAAARFSPDGRALAISYLDGRGSHTRLVRAPSFEEIAAAEKDRTETWSSQR